MDGPSVNIRDLRVALTRLLDRFELEHGPQVDLGADHYWTLAGRDAYGVEPGEPTVGQLSDDTSSLDELVGRSDGDLVIWHDLAHVAAILQRIAVIDLPA